MNNVKQTSLREESIRQIINFKYRYQNQWVALDESSREVIDASKDLVALVKKLANRHTKYVLEKVLPPETVLVP